MPYQYKREPLSDDEVNRLSNACETFDEKLIIWTLLDTGLRVSELANLKKDNILWQERRHEQPHHSKNRKRSGQQDHDREAGHPTRPSPYVQCQLHQKGDLHSIFNDPSWS